MSRTHRKMSHITSRGQYVKNWKVPPGADHRMKLDLLFVFDIPARGESLSWFLFRTSRWRPQKVDKRMVLEYTHGLFIT